MLDRACLFDFFFWGGFSFFYDFFIVVFFLVMYPCECVFELVVFKGFSFSGGIYDYYFYCVVESFVIRSVRIISLSHLNISIHVMRLVVCESL